VDVLVSDLDMPEMNGLELTSQVRRSHPEVVRVVITGQATVGTVMQAINEGEVFRFLAKPWRAEELMEVLSAAVKRREEPSLTPPPGLLNTRRAKQTSALERGQPGLTAVPRGVGVHVVDERRLQGLLARLGRPPWQAPDEPARRPTHKGIPIA
jgi:DNA-binding NarL/FixJ family response regulator